ncbi:ABC transporter ATP-binding protein [Streptomyces sp. NPDC003860]
MSVLLQLTDVQHGYDGQSVLNGVSLGVEAGECVVLLGENGSGKSTLLRLAAGREVPESGSVTLRGTAVDEDDWAVRATVAAVMDTGTGYPDLSVREHLMLVALAHGLADDADDAVDDMLAEHHLTARADALPHQLSSGQTQLLALAQAFIRPAELLLLDEPEQRLDSDARRRLAERLQSLKEQGTAVLLATHNRELAKAVADAEYTVSGGGLLVAGGSGD